MMYGREQNHSTSQSHHIGFPLSNTIKESKQQNKHVKLQLLKNTTRPTTVT